MQQITRRLSEIESAYASVPDADPVETHQRLLRMRNGTNAAALNSEYLIAR